MTTKPWAAAALSLTVSTATLLAGASLGALALGATPARAGTCIGYCGAILPHGNVLAPPGGNPRTPTNFVTSYSGELGVGLDGVGGFNGSVFSSRAFSLGSHVTFDMNFITTDWVNADPAYRPDYAWAALRPAGTGYGFDHDVFMTVRMSQHDGAVFDGEGWPELKADLIQQTSVAYGPTEWLPLGHDSHRCFSTGCGQSGWFSVDYDTSAGGLYVLEIGVANTNDITYSSALAFANLRIDGELVSDRGDSRFNPILPDTIDGDGRFLFDFATYGPLPTYIDPAMASGYDYEVFGDSPLISQAWFPELDGDLDGYDIYALSDPDLFLAHVGAGEWLDFASLGFANGVNGFALRDIDVDLDPTDTGAFVTGLQFAGDGMVHMSQTPFTAGVPEPATWAVMILGFGMSGALLRRRRLAPAVA